MQPNTCRQNETFFLMADMSSQIWMPYFCYDGKSDLSFILARIIFEISFLIYIFYKKSTGIINCHESRSLISRTEIHIIHSINTYAMNYNCITLFSGIGSDGRWQCITLFSETGSDGRWQLCMWQYRPYLWCTFVLMPEIQKIYINKLNNLG